MFDQGSVNFEILKKRAYNLRWATVPEGVIPLTAADSDFPSAPEIAEAICSFAKDRYYCYGPAGGMPEFKEAVAKYFIEKRNIPASASFVLPVDSAAFGIYITCKAFLGPGDEAIIFDPVDFLFRYSVEALGGVAVSFPIPAGTMQIDIEQLEGLITARTKLICLCNPLNPTGKVFSSEELLQIATLASRYNLIILSDEIWSDITFAPCRYVSMASVSEEARNRTVTVTGYSKAYGLAGLRIGAVLASNENHYDLLLTASLHQSTIHGANVLSQIAATAALEKCGYWLHGFLEHLARMRELCVRELNAVPDFRCIAPDGCYVAFVDIKDTNKTSAEMAEMLMNNAKVAVVPGLKQWFGAGAEGYIRISFATSEDILMEAMSRIRNSVTL